MKEEEQDEDKSKNLWPPATIKHSLVEYCKSIGGDPTSEIHNFNLFLDADRLQFTFNRFPSGECLITDVVRRPLIINKHEIQLHTFQPILPSKPFLKFLNRFKICFPIVRTFAFDSLVIMEVLHVDSAYLIVDLRDVVMWSREFDAKRLEWSRKHEEVLNVGDRERTEEKMI